ncbi:MAG: DUF1513 domain-containing protein [Pseudomonadota bacterium]
MATKAVLAFQKAPHPVGAQPGAGCSRRTLLQRLAIAVGVLATRGALAAPPETAVYVGVETAATGQSRATFFTASGARAASLPLTFRAHGLAQHRGQLAVFPRRPGNRFALIDLKTLTPTATVTAPPNRHFYGHGAFTRDGAHLLVPENDLETLAGHIAIYDRAGTRRGALPLPGAGPHEIIRAATADRFHIALGGLETHPDYGRTPLNAATFVSQTVTLEWESAALTAADAPLQSEGVSLRHLAEDAAGRLYVGGQTVDGARAAHSNVLFVIENGVSRAIPLGGRLAGYVSSVAAAGETVVVTSKESGRALTLRNGDLIAETALDGASAAGLGAAHRAVSGYTLLSLDGTAVRAADAHEFDNHGLMLTQPR